MPAVQLLPMSEVGFQAYLQHAAADYAAEHVRTGNWLPDEALELAQKEIGALLPQGVTTENQYLFTVLDAASRERVGLIWMAVSMSGARRAGFIYDFSIDPKFQRRGYGRATLEALAEKARDWKIESLGLHVFADNAAARKLYEQAGYRVIGLNMTKPIS